MRALRGHATDAPARWKEPGAFPAADHASQRARQGRGRRRIHRRVRRQCGGRRRPAGSLIPHAGAIRPLMVTMIEPAFRTLSVSPAGRLARPPTRHLATRRRAIGMASIAGRTNGERPIAEATDLLPERRVHDVGAAARFDWTRRANRGTRETTGSVAVGASRWSPRVWRISSRPSLHSPHRAAYVTRRPGPNRDRPWTLPEPWTHRTRPPLLGKPAQNAGFPQAPTAILFSVEKKTKNEDKNRYDDSGADLRGFR